MANIQRRGQQQPRRRDVKERTMNRYAALDSDITSRYDDEDEDEVRLPITQRVNIRQMRGGQTALVRNRNLERQAPGNQKREQIWQITVRSQGRGSIQFVSQALQENVSDFMPFNFSLDANQNVNFYVLTEEEAETIKFLNRRISLPDSKDKLMIFLKKGNAPWETLTPNMKKTIKDVVTNRFNQQTNSLDLSGFQHDKGFSAADLTPMSSLSRNAVMVEVAKIVAQGFNQIRGISLKGNRLSHLDTAQTLTFAAPNVVELDLSDNNIPKIKELDKLSKWGIEKIHVENNPFYATYQDASSLTSAIHDTFPRVNYLDGTIVHVDPFKVTADCQRKSGVLYPPVKPGFAPDDALKTQVEQLLLQYFEAYDDPQPAKSRQNLIHAYDDDATFTHVIQTIPDVRAPKRGDEDAFKQYIRSSHNLLHEEKWQNYREKIIYKGAMEIAVALSRLPATHHLKDSFVLDFIFVTNDLMVFSLRGIMRDGRDVSDTLVNSAFKFFQRTMAVIPKAEGKMAIVNDQLTLTPISNERMERYNKMIKKALETPNETPKPSTLNMNGMNLAEIPGPSGLQQQLQVRQEQPQQQAQAPPTTPNYDINDPQIREQMIEAFMAQSGMNRTWSQQCLQELNWDFEAAGRAFNESRAQIPPEAFVQ